MPLKLIIDQGRVSINGTIYDNPNLPASLPENALVDTVGNSAFFIRSSSENQYAEVRGESPWKVSVTSALLAPSAKGYDEDQQPIIFFHTHCCCDDGYYELQTQDGSVRIGLK